jgi:acyl carrier protein
MSNRVIAREVRDFVLAKLSPALHAKGLNSESVADDFDLLTEGAVDSQALLEIILAVEEHFDLQLELEQLDPEHLTEIGSFCQYIEQQAGGNSISPMSRC